MIIAIDVHYRENLAKTVSVEFNDWQDASPSNIHTLDLPVADTYQPGEFYKRELPCIQEILKLSDLQKCVAIIIDGYVVLSDDGRSGLGGYLYESLNPKIPVIGVAKKRFHNNEENVAEVLRGESQKPLYITCVGMELAEAGEKIRSMSGEFRMPALLKILDQETKK